VPHRIKSFTFAEKLLDGLHALSQNQKQLIEVDSHGDRRWSDMLTVGSTPIMIHIGKATV
jgi:hypothetical protein